MTPELRAKVQALGPDLTPEMVQATQALFAPLHSGMARDTLIARDAAYGPDARHRLDVFRRDGAERAPVLVYVHGGGFVRGDKRTPGTPYFDNIGDFAARAGLIGVTLTYRLAPAHPWPAGPEDMALSVDWLRANIAAYGGDPGRIYLMGQSAGAVHVASYVAFEQPHIAGAILVSCAYDSATAHDNAFHRAYYGDDPAAWSAASAQAGLIASEVPLLCSVSEFDPSDFQKQAAAFVGAWGVARGAYPRMLWLEGHNHLSPAYAIGSAADALGPAILNFIASEEA